MFLKIKNNALYIISFLKKKAILKLKLDKTDFPYNNKKRHEEHKNPYAP